MPKTHPRRNAREGVLQALYAQQFSEEKTTITLDRILDESPVRKKNNKFISALYYSVLEHHDWTDEIIKKHLQNWEFERVAQVDRVLLKMGICEIYFMDDIPPKVTISEMVEIAKVYSTEESSGFINGILDAVFKEFQKQEKN